MKASVHRPSIFLDVDDVLCPNAPYGGRHVYEALRFPDNAPEDLYTRLFCESSVGLLSELRAEFDARVVMTTSWLLLFDRPQFEYIFRRTGLAHISANFHPRWAAPANRGRLRLDAILKWLQQNHRGEPFVVLDDEESGDSLVGSRLARVGRVVLCGPTGCLQTSHLALARQALSEPVYTTRSSTSNRD